MGNRTGYWTNRCEPFLWKPMATQTQHRQQTDVYWAKQHSRYFRRRRCKNRTNDWTTCRFRPNRTLDSHLTNRIYHRQRWTLSTKPVLLKPTAQRTANRISRPPRPRATSRTTAPTAPCPTKRIPNPTTTLPTTTCPINTRMATRPNPQPTATTPPATTWPSRSPSGCNRTPIRCTPIVCWPTKRPTRRTTTTRLTNPISTLARLLSRQRLPNPSPSSRPHRRWVTTTN